MPSSLGNKNKYHNHSLELPHNWGLSASAQDPAVSSSYLACTTTDESIFRLMRGGNRVGRTIFSLTTQTEFKQFQSALRQHEKLEQNKQKHIKWCECVITWHTRKISVLIIKSNGVAAFEPSIYIIEWIAMQMLLSQKEIYFHGKNILIYATSERKG